MTYDILFVFGPYHDTEYADQLFKDIKKNGCDDDCYKNGCRWSIIFKLCGVTTIMIAVNFILVIVGAYEAHSRICGICCNLVLGCLSMAAIITAMVFRYDKIGELASISYAAAEYESTNATTGTINMSTD